MAAHAAPVELAWRVGATEVPLLSAVGVPGYPGIDPALPALAEALARGRLQPPLSSFVDFTGGPGAVLGLGHALSGVRGSMLAVSAAVRRTALELGVDEAACRADHPWDLPAASVDEVWWRPASERGWARFGAELAGWSRALTAQGRLIAVWHKDQGARRAERLVAERFETLEVVNRASGWRVVEARGPRAETPGPWLSWDGPDGPMRTLVGTFAADRLDAGSALLLEALSAYETGGREARSEASADLAGARVLDLGCGSGVLARRALRAGAASVLALDDDLAAVRSSEATLAGEGKARVDWSDLTLDAPEARELDVVITNPPFHVGRSVVGALSRGFVAAAHTALRPGGRLWLVANAALPFDRLLASWQSVREVTPAGARAYRVFTALRAKSSRRTS